MQQGHGDEAAATYDEAPGRGDGLTCEAAGADGSPATMDDVEAVAGESARVLLEAWKGLVHGVWWCVISWVFHDCRHESRL